MDEKNKMAPGEWFSFHRGHEIYSQVDYEYSQQHKRSIGKVFWICMECNCAYYYDQIFNWKEITKD
jgi:hypothetical protein